MSDDELAALIPAASAPGVRRGWGCPGDGELAAWVEGRLPAAAREKLAEHLAGCNYCCGQVGFLARAGEMGPPPAVPAHLLAAARGERAPLFGLLRPATLAAAGAGLVLALLVASPWGRPGSFSAGAEAERVVRTARTVRGPADAPWIVRPAEGEIVSRTALELRWEEAPEALFYSVQLVDPKGDVIWEGRADGARLSVPASATLAPGQPYFAWVLAHLRSGTTVRSPVVGFRLAPG